MCIIHYSRDWIIKTDLILIGSPGSVMAPAFFIFTYLFGGISFVCIYNMGSGILRAVGDSKTPLYYLIVASIINIILDFVFVLYFHMGVAGAGWATFIAQGISALLVMIKLVFSKEIYKVEFKDISIDMPILKKIIEIGIPTALQQSIVSFSNVIVQSYINTFGANAVAGYTSYVKLMDSYSCQFKFCDGYYDIYWTEHWCACHRSC